jgi:hypothetical protein
MHTKEELTKKRNKSSEQLDLVNTISTADKLKNKRRWLYLALFITTGLSLLFWLYRSLKTITFPPALPQISIDFPHSSPPSVTFSPQLSSLLSQHPQIIGFYLGHDHPVQNLTSGSLSDLNLAVLKTTLSSQSPVSRSANAALLPQGMVYRELITTSTTQITLASLITNPIDQIFVVIRFNGPSSSLKTLAPDLISAAYWSVSSN